MRRKKSEPLGSSMRKINTMCDNGHLCEAGQSQVVSLREKKRTAARAALRSVRTACSPRPSRDNLQGSFKETAATSARRVRAPVDSHPLLTPPSTSWPLVPGIRPPAVDRHGSLGAQARPHCLHVKLREPNVMEMQGGAVQMVGCGSLFRLR
ncbi:hypothetical protein EYF80_029899 [Liparis tanakae]|uniref:Uncharacterized protein n=1 Tax=Liparis tanakae TaxID=230148 RepID=A0A4Z2H311_9TELE|nr:hypothetical protein EYF80_029899 [Liparis tanakae]